MNHTLRNGLALAGVSLLALALAGCQAMGFSSTEVQEVGALVSVEDVHSGYLERTLELTGSVDAGQSIRMVPDMPGKVKRLPVKVGDRVPKGTLLAQLDLDMAQLQKEQAEAAVKLAELQLESATTEFGRAEQLHQSGSLTGQQFDQARTGLSMAEQQLAQASAARGLASEQISGGALYAPFDGVVTQVGCEQGEYFNPMGMSATGGAAVLVSLVNLDTIRVDLQVADSDIGRIRDGMSVRIWVDVVSDQLSEEGIEGTVTNIGLAADPATRTFPVRVEATNPEQIVRAGMHARVGLVLERKEGVLYVPADALRNDGSGDYVMVAGTAEKGSVARKTDVTIALKGDQGVEIVSGLEGGEKVVVEGNFGLPDGALIEVSQ